MTLIRSYVLTISFSALSSTIRCKGLRLIKLENSAYSLGEFYNEFPGLQVQLGELVYIIRKL